MIPTPTYIENHKLVLDAFGCWPSFHDAEIQSITMDCTSMLATAPINNVRLEMMIHCWELTNELNEKGFYKLRKHHSVRFEFDMIHEVTLKNFGQQNCVYYITFEEIPVEKGKHHLFKVILDSSSNSEYAFHGEFTAFAGRVLSVTPYSPADDSSP